MLHKGAIDSGNGGIYLHEGYAFHAILKGFNAFFLDDN